MANINITDVIFHEVKYLTSAQVNAKVLKAIYEASLSVSRGVYVEIGPAQGGSTLAIALGRHSAGRTETLYTADVFTESAALMSTDVRANVAVLRKNLAEYDLGEHVRVIVVPEEDVATIVPLDAEIGLFFVDADGALDRDFAQFYDRILPGGHIILDDCENKISDKYLGYSDEKLQKYVRSKHADDIADLNPVGKHYTVYRFVQALIELGLMEEIQTVSNTAFFRKVGNKAYAESGAPEALAEARAGIASEFFARREKFFSAAAHR
jgi:predicted O-methyltransferase YrrM